MDFSVQNELDREFYKKDFGSIHELVKRIRSALTDSTDINISDIDFQGVLDYKQGFSQIYVTLFQGGLEPIRWGSCNGSLNDALNRIIAKLKENKTFKSFDISDNEKCRIMLEYVIDETPVRLFDIEYGAFSPKRFEPGITGIKLVLEGQSHYYMPTEAWTKSHLDIKPVLNTILRKTRIKDITNKISERIEVLSHSTYECFLIKSRAFISYKDNILPLYRGTLLNEYSPEAIKDIALNGADWIIKYQQPDGKFLYYYDAKEDNYVDHEHPTRSEDNLYYNDLRHCGGIITLVRAYQLTKDEKYLVAAKKGLDFIVSLTSEHTYNGKPAGFVYYNNKGKLGGTGVALTALMKYRTETDDKTYDEYIKKYVRHILSRVYETGEILGYYIHPLVQDGRPLISMSDEERRQTFSFYYPGEALLGLALFANYFKDDEELRNEVIEKSKIALDWIVDERPKIYYDLFTALPSDAWLMQAIEEWAENSEFRKQNYLDFVFGDAQTMIDKMYKKDDSPYIDYEGAYYYNYGDHYYPDGSRSEGLIAAYYLAKKIGDEDKAQKIMEAARLTAKSQMVLVNNEYNNYAHKNPEKSKGSIRFKATRQWVRVDSIQHVACFYFRLYFAEKGIIVK